MDTIESTKLMDGFKPSRSGRIGRISTIALNAFREAVRDRVLYNLVLFVLLLTAGAIYLGASAAT